MKSKHKFRRENLSFGWGVCISLGISVFTGLILSLLLTTFVINEHIDENMIGYITPIITLIASFLGCITSGKLIGERLAVVIGITGALYLAVCVFTGVLLFNGGFHNLWIRLLTIVISWAVSCAICIRGQGSGRKRKRAYS